MTVDWDRVQELKAGLSIKNKSRVETKFWYSSVPTFEDIALTPKSLSLFCDASAPVQFREVN